LDQITAGGRLPVDHLACDEDAGELRQHQVLSQTGPAHAPSRGNRLVDRTRSSERDPARLYGRRNRLSGPEWGRGELLQDRQGGSAQAQSILHGGDRVARHVAQLFGEPLNARVGFEIDGELRMRHGSQSGGELVERSAFQSIARDH
jgi:hypothetical protein